MPTTKRAWLYVIRNPKRTVLLLILLVALMTISLLGLALYSASGDAVKELRSSIGGYFTIQQSAEGTQKTDEQLLEQVRTLDNVSKINGVDTYYMYCDGLDLVHGSYSGTGLPGEYVPKFIGCTESALHERFVAVSYQLADGRHITAEDKHKAMISKEVAELNGLSVGDTLHASIVEGVAGWQPEHTGTQVDFEIVGIYLVTRSEPVTPGTLESELQENVIFTDINTAKELYQLKFPDRTAEQYNYSGGLMLFLDDPARMEQTVAALKAQPYADWDGFIISENNARYEQTAGAIQKAETISFFLLIVILVLSIGILALILLMWTRERMTEVGILISLGISPKGITGQIVLENYYVALPAFLIAALLSLSLFGVIGNAIGGQQQRVAIARALASAAPIILADEPTGNLDEDTARDVTELLVERARSLNKCVIIVSHSNEVAAAGDVILWFSHGEIEVT